MNSKHRSNLYDWLITSCRKLGIWAPDCYAAMLLMDSIIDRIEISEHLLYCSACMMITLIDRDTEYFHGIPTWREYTDYIYTNRRMRDAIFKTLEMLNWKTRIDGDVFTLVYRNHGYLRFRSDPYRLLQSWIDGVPITQEDIENILAPDRQIVPSYPTSLWFKFTDRQYRNVPDYIICENLGLSFQPLV